MRLLKVYLKTLSVLAVGLMAALFLVACDPKMSSEEPCHFIQNSRLQRISWKDGVARFYVHSSVPVEAYPAIRGAIEVWNKAVGRELIRIESWYTTGYEVPARDGYSIIYWQNFWDESQPNEQARTTVHYTGNRLDEADIQINAAHFGHHFWQEDLGKNEEIRGIDLKSLLIHEFGHAVGLGHIEVSESVMYARLSAGYGRRKLNDLDLAALRCEY